MLVNTLILFAIYTARFTEDELSYESRKIHKDGKDVFSEIYRFIQRDTDASLNDSEECDYTRPRYLPFSDILSTETIDNSALLKAVPKDILG